MGQLERRPRKNCGAAELARMDVKKSQGWKPRIANHKEVEDRIDVLAKMLHNSFITSTTKDDNPWGFNSTNWPLGPADNDDSATGFLLQLFRWGAQFFLVEEKHKLVGMAITLVLSDKVTQHPRYQFSDLGILPGDLDFVVYCVDPAFRGRGISTALIEASIGHTLQMKPQPRMFFVRTHANHRERVIGNFEGYGLTQLGAYSLKQFGEETPRVILGTLVTNLLLPND